MKVYRAIEFSKLIWLISDDAALLWNEANIIHDRDNTHDSNWWMNELLVKYRTAIVTDVILNGREKFFEKSLEFNALQGGRFNPSRSFGVLYTSSHPFMSALEVLYHQFVNAYPLYKKMNNNSSQFTSSFNVRVPQHLKTLIVVFEIEIDNSYCIKEICCDIDSLKDTCKKLGFERYIGDSFNREFIFGNDYEISRIFGCYLHTDTDPSYKVPSARIDFDVQDTLDIRNYLIPERKYDENKIGLTGYYLDFFSNVNLELNEDDVHEVNVIIEGKSKVNTKFSLQPIPQNNKPKDQILRYEPNVDGSARKKYFREVQIQKFY